MPRNQKDSQFREGEEERDEQSATVEAPRVDEHEVEDDRAQSKLDEEAAQEVDDEDLVEEIDLDELTAMEGPDA